MKRFILAGLMCCAITLGVAAQTEVTCADLLGCVVLAPNEPVQLAVLAPLSGEFASSSRDEVRGLELAILNRQSAVKGHPVELQQANEGCDAEQGVAATEELLENPQLVAILGAACELSVADMLPLISQAGHVYISFTNSNNAWTNPNPDTGGRYQAGFFRVIHQDLLQGQLAGRFLAQQLGAQTMAILYENTTYNLGMRDVYRQGFTANLGSVLREQEVNETTDLTALAAELAAITPDVIVLAVPPSMTALILPALKTQNALLTSILIASDSSISADLLTSVGTGLTGVYTVQPFVTGEAYLNFRTQYEAQFGQAPASGFHAHAYDAMQLTLQALETSSQTLEDGTLIIGRQALRDALQATQGLAGLTGLIACQANGECGSGRALAVFLLTSTTITEAAWPPMLVYTLFRSS